MNPKNKNWDARERHLENEPELQSVYDESFSDADDEISLTERNSMFNEIRYLNNKIRHLIELDARNHSMAMPDSIISFRSNGFDINVDNMPVEKKYRFRFEDSRYIIWKNADDELVMKEMD